MKCGESFSATPEKSAMLPSPPQGQVLPAGWQDAAERESSAAVQHSCSSIVPKDKING